MRKYLKAEVSKHRSGSNEELKDAIHQEISGIPLEMLARMMENFRERLQICVAHQGKHLNGIIFKKTLNMWFGKNFLLHVLYIFFFTSEMWKLITPQSVQ